MGSSVCTKTLIPIYDHHVRLQSFFNQTRVGIFKNLLTEKELVPPPNNTNGQWPSIKIAMHSSALVNFGLIHGCVTYLRITSPFRLVASTINRS